MTERISVHDILEAGIHTRGQTLLWNEVEDALTPSCEHQDHATDADHSGEVHRLTLAKHACTVVPEKYVCDGFWSIVEEGFSCAECGYWTTPESYIVLAEF